MLSFRGAPQLSRVRRNLVVHFHLHRPLTLFLIVLAVVFAAEILVMLLLPTLVHEAVGDWHRAVIDAALLLLFSAPPLWFLIIDPLRDAALLERRRAETIIDNAAQGILTIDSNQNLCSMNRAAEKLLGATAIDMIGHSVTRLLPEWSRQLVEQSKIEFRVPISTGGSRPVAVSVSSLSNEEGGGHVLLIRDLTDQRLAERNRVEAAVMRAEQLAIVAQVATGVAHELRNPLTSLKMLIQTNREEFITSGMPTDDFNLIDQEIRRMETALHDFLNLARPSPPRPELVSLDELITRTFRLVETRARRQHVDLVFAAGVRTTMLHADRDHLQQLFLNLAINALDAMPSGGVLTVDIETTSDGMQLIRFADTGAGIPAAILPRLFEAFVTSKPTGTGLGLVVSRRIVEEHGGEISADNRPEGGAVFTVRLAEIMTERVSTS